MRTLAPKLKETRSVPIPAALRESLGEAVELVREAEGDPDLGIDYGDAIQCGDVCGGRIGRPPRDFHFTYYPEDDARRGRWFLELSLLEMEDIAEGHITELTLHCCTGLDCRTKFSSPSESCGRCDYRDDPEDAARKLRLEEASRSCRSKLDWVRVLLREAPEATAATVIGEYNSIDGLGERLGWFSFEEADRALAQARAAEPEAQAVEPNASLPSSETPLTVEQRAEAFVSALLNEELLELTTARSRAPLTSFVADLLDRAVDPASLATAIEEASGVAELYATDDDVARLLAATGWPNRT